MSQLRRAINGCTVDSERDIYEGLAALLHLADQHGIKVFITGETIECGFDVLSDFTPDYPLTIDCIAVPANQEDDDA